MIKSNFKEFEKDLAKQIEEQQEAQKNTFRKIVFTAFSDVVRRSPVDTGYFRTNNLIQEGTPNNSTVENIESPSSLTKKAQLKLDKTKVQDDTTIYITNNVPYADRLENGYSSQAPQGMFKLAEARTKGIYEQLKNKVVK